MVEGLHRKTKNQVILASVFMNLVIEKFPLFEGKVGMTKEEYERAVKSFEQPEGVTEPYNDSSGRAFLGVVLTGI